jgi:hypothetical protein
VSLEGAAQEIKQLFAVFRLAQQQRGEAFDQAGSTGGSIHL